MNGEDALRHLNIQEVPDDVKGVVFLRNHTKLREWAAKNAFSIVFMGGMFIITWIILLVTNL